MYGQNALSKDARDDAIGALVQAASRKLSQSGNAPRTLQSMLDTALRAAQQPEEARALLTIAASAEGRIEQAESLVREALKSEPTNANLLTQLGYIQLQFGKADQARSSFETALRYQPTLSAAFRGIADALYKKGDWTGAFLHYRSLFEKGLTDPELFRNLEQCAARIQADHWDASLGAFVLACLEHEDVLDRPFAPLANSLLIHRYALNVSDSIIDVDALAEDSLFLLTVAKGLILSPELEETAVALRRSLLEEVVATQTLADNRLALTLALAHAATLCQHVWPVADDERQVIDQISELVKDTLFSKGTADDVAGAVLIISMYQLLYRSAASSALLGTDREHWPTLMTDLMDRSLWRPCDIHMRMADLRARATPHGSVADIYAAGDQLPWPDYGPIRLSSSQLDLYGLMNAQLGPDVWPFRKRPLNVLVTECATGRRAYELANQFSDVNVMAIDSRLVNIAAAQTRHEAHHLPVEFLPIAPDQVQTLNTRFDLIEHGKSLNHTPDPAYILAQLKRIALPHHGLIKVRVTLFDNWDAERIIQTLVSQQVQSAAPEAVANLRQAIFADTQRDDWAPVLSDPSFYSLEGVRQNLFGGIWHRFTPSALEELLKANSLSIIGLIHMGSHSKLYRKPASLTEWYASRAHAIEKPVDLVLYLTNDQ
ncbi:MAG: hypothetical protein D6758_12970 [Gammaproteobacteria bacterium]|nr:MAG: hypothetical protein D6758_12970 [Gammaproteobacteria bacterium]